jgi:hypothetical protein
MTPDVNDLVNCGFLSAGAIAQWANVKRILRDKQVCGVVWQLSAIYIAWGFWGLYYWPSLHQWWSFAAEMILTIGSTVWGVLAVWYTLHPEAKYDSQ